MAEQNLVRDHVGRCLELYGQPLDDDFNEPITRQSYEQMRADLMLALGMLLAANSGKSDHA